MNKRSREILSQLITKTEYSQTISIQELADMFKVSSRTIRYDIDQINDYLKENHLQPLNLGKRGVINTEPDITKARESLSEEGFYSFKLTREERVSFAAVLMICSDDYITLSEIADQQSFRIWNISKLFAERDIYMYFLIQTKGCFWKEERSINETY